MQMAGGMATAATHQVSGMGQPLGLVRLPTVALMASKILGMMPSSCCGAWKAKACRRAASALAGERRRSNLLHGLRCSQAKRWQVAGAAHCATERATQLPPQLPRSGSAP